MVPDIRGPLIHLLALLVGSGAAWAAGVAGAPQQDIVAVEARVPLSDSEVSGLADGAGLMDRLRGIGQILSAGVGDAARDELAVELRTVANALNPETEPLLGAARALRTRIEARADSSTRAGAAPAAPSADSDDPHDTGVLPKRGGKP